MKLLYFSAPWCGPCQTFGPLLDRVIKEFPELELEKLDLDQNFDRAWEHRVSKIPTLVSEKGAKLVGAANEDDLRAWLTRQSTK